MSTRGHDMRRYNWYLCGTGCTIWCSRVSRYPEISKVLWETLGTYTIIVISTVSCVHTIKLDRMLFHASVP